ncbi:MAG: hypothetical protein QF793_02740 [Candidatus Peribacteraceae bacterium]|jgi:selenophosphate synthase|nr:hypothetical protein [Candidatus Peribacteraceae bacterium]|tara:strand:- start:17228 stop:17557 length:330 start_codon:yes stop_codon:yes gene_type:complete
MSDQDFQPLDNEILHVLSDSYEMPVNKLHGAVNAERAEKSKWRHVKLGWMVGVSRKRVEESLSRLVAGGLISKDTREAVINVLGMIDMGQVDHYQKIRNGSNTSREQSA